MRCRPPWWRRHHGVATHRCKCINNWLTFSNKHCTNRQRFSSRICRTVWISERLNACPIFEYRSNTQTHTCIFLDVLNLSQWQNTHCFCSFTEECNRSPLWGPFRVQLLRTEEDMRVELAYEKMMAAWLLVGFEVDIGLSENGVNKHLWPLKMVTHPCFWPTWKLSWIWPLSGRILYLPNTDGRTQVSSRLLILVPARASWWCKIDLR